MNPFSRAHSINATAAAPHTHRPSSVAAPDVPHGILLKGDKIGSGLQITHNEFAGGSIYSYPSDPSKLQLMGVRIEDNSFGGSNGKATRARATLTQKAATAWSVD